MSIIKRLQTKLHLLQHSGSKYCCPFCGYHSKDLEIVGHDIPVLKDKQVIGGGERAAGCFKCESRDRERLLYAYLIEEIELPSNKDLSILHMAPEPKLSKILLNQHFTEYVCGDLFTEGYEYPAFVKNIDAHHIPYPENHLDWVICNHVLEHIPDDIAVMKEFHRVLKPNGRAILQVPISKNSLKTEENFTIADPKEREALFGQFDHVRIYGQDYVDRLQQAGFKVHRVNISEKYKHLGVNADEDLFVCEKPK